LPELGGEEYSAASLTIYKGNGMNKLSTLFASLHFYLTDLIILSNGSIYTSIFFRKLKPMPLQSKTGGVAQVVEHLPEALSSSPSTTKKNPKQTKSKTMNYITGHLCFYMENFLQVITVSLFHKSISLLAVTKLWVSLPFLEGPP
jgi:hypothetical protein